MDISVFVRSRQPLEFMRPNRLSACYKGDPFLRR